MEVFYPGLHQPSDAKHFRRACVSVNRLRDRKSPIPNCRLFVDSGAFTEIALHGRYRHGSEVYALELARIDRDIAPIEIAVSQDFMCEGFMLAKTGLTVAEHQRLTVERFDELNFCLDIMLPERTFPLLPVLQGYEPQEYVRHVQMYGDRLKPGMWVGVGSVCKRNGSPKQIEAVLEAIHKARPGLRLHGFGVKMTSLKNPRVRELLYSADSMAWSYAARRENGRQNDWREAKRFTDAIEGVISS